MTCAVVEHALTPEAETRPCLPGSYRAPTGLRIIFPVSRVPPLIILPAYLCHFINLFALHGLFVYFLYVVFS
jgi:hypothetical protein